MKKTFIILIAIISLTISCQTRNEFILFRTISYEDNRIVNLKVDTITYTNRLDLDFYRKNFFKPYDYPNPFVDKRYKNELITIWQDTTKAKDYKTNWTFTFKYDSLSRVVEYSYSGCYICSQLPFTLSIFYDNKNRPIRFRNMGFHSPLTKNQNELKNSQSEPPFEDFEFLYDNKDNIIQIRHFTFGKLIEQIDKI